MIKREMIVSRDKKFRTAKILDLKSEKAVMESHYKKITDEDGVPCQEAKTTNDFPQEKCLTMMKFRLRNEKMLKVFY